MSGLFPEFPILFYPSIAEKFGAEEAILLAVYDQYARHHGDRDAQGRPYFVARRTEWLGLVSFWAEDRFAELTNSLVSQGVLDAEFHANGSIRIGLKSEGGESAPVGLAPVPEPVVQTPVPETVQLLESARSPMPVAQAPTFEPEVTGQSTEAYPRAEAPHRAEAPYRAEAPHRTEAPHRAEAPRRAEAHYGAEALHRAEAPRQLPRGPAPSFGGSTGWSRPKDDLQHLFENRERQNKQMHEVTLDWRPNQTTYQMFQKRNIPVDFIDSCIDEFVSYWMALGTKKHTWDAEFIKRVNGQWVKEQSRQGRIARQSGQESIEGSGERYQSNHRAERRQRITEAVMDIQNTDW